MVERHKTLTEASCSWWFSKRCYDSTVSRRQRCIGFVNVNPCAHHDLAVLLVVVKVILVTDVGMVVAATTAATFTVLFSDKDRDYYHGE